MTRTSQYIDCADRGLTMVETAVAMGVTRQAVHHASKAHGIIFRDAARRNRETETVRVNRKTLSIISALAAKRGASIDVVIDQLVSAGAREFL